MKRSFFTFPIAALALALSQPVMADSGGHDNSDGHHIAQSSETETAMPSAAEAWTTLQGGYEQAVSISDGGNLEEMHGITDSMAAAVKILRDNADDNNHLDKTLSYVEKAVGDLHVKADGGDAAGTVSALKKLNGVLKLVKAALPEDVYSQNTEHHMQDGGDDAHGEEHEVEKSHGSDGHAH